MQGTRWQWGLISCLWLTGVVSAQEADTEFRVEERPDRLMITSAMQPVGEFVFRDDKIWRPYFANVCAPGGASGSGTEGRTVQVTRNHPPQPGVDDVDHDTMHPGVWLAFGDLNGADFWRNKGKIEHVQFLTTPQIGSGQVHFATESRCVSGAGVELCQLQSRFTIQRLPTSFLIVWVSTFRPLGQPLVFGDQEEMGFGARVATPLTEKNGGRIRSSTGAETAAATWGQAADWCDYSGTLQNQPAGLMLLTSPDNFRRSWWHNRNYGVFVANPFGRAALQQGDVSRVEVATGEEFRLAFGAVAHAGPDFDPMQAYQRFQSLVSASPPAR